MKKIMILTASALVLGAAASQAQVTFGISPEVGINFANEHAKYESSTTVGGNTYTNSSKYDGGIKLGLKLGANADIGLGDHLSLQPGVFYSIMGSKGNAGYTVNGISSPGNDNNFTIHYIQVPLNIQYMFNDPDEGRFFIGIGGYYGIALGGQNKTTDASGNKKSTSIEFSAGTANTYGALQRSDYGLSGNAGYLLRSGIFFRGMYQFGLANLASYGNSNNYFKNTCITASIGYVLGHKPSNAKPTGGM